MDLITSIPSRVIRTDAFGQDIGEVYTSKCIESWQQNGFKPVSLNRENEIEDIRKKFSIQSDVFVDSDDAIYKGRFGPSFGDILINRSQSKPICIVNADVCMLRYADLALKIENLAEQHVLFAQRIDIGSMDYACPSLYAKGVDLIALRPNLIAELFNDRDIRKFKLGIFWWDYVLPIAASFFTSVRRIGDPLILHYMHEVNWDTERYAQLRAFAFEALLRLAGSQRSSSSSAALFRDLVGELNLDNREDAGTFFEICLDWLSGRIGPIKEIALGSVLQQNDISNLLRASVTHNANAMKQIENQERELTRLYREVAKYKKYADKRRKLLDERGNTTRELREKLRELERANRELSKSLDRNTARDGRRTAQTLSALGRTELARTIRWLQRQLPMHW